MRVWFWPPVRSISSISWICVFRDCLGEIECQWRRAEADRVDTAATVKTVEAEIFDGEDIVSAAADEDVGTTAAIEGVVAGSADELIRCGRAV